MMKKEKKKEHWNTEPKGKWIPQEDNHDGVSQTEMHISTEDKFAKTLITGYRENNKQSPDIKGIIAKRA